MASGRGGRWRRREPPAGATEAAAAGSGDGVGDATRSGGREAQCGATALGPTGSGSSEPQVWYFGFGANINPRKLQEQRRIVPVEQVPGRLPGWRLVFNHKGGMGNIEPLDSHPAGPDAVHGMLLLLRSGDFERLAKMEYEYEVRELEVVAYDQRTISARAFTTPSAYRLNFYPAPPERYLNLIREGASTMGLESAYQEWLQQLPCIKGQRGEEYWSVPAPANAAWAAPKRPSPPPSAAGGAGTGSGSPLRLRALAAFGRDGALVEIGANLGKCSQQDLAAQLVRAAAARVSHIVLTGCSVKGSRDAQRICDEWSAEAGFRLAEQTLGAAAREEMVREGITELPSLAFTAGVHPHEAKTCNAGTLATLREMAAHPRCVAIGECGLDYDRMFTTREVQLEWFRRQVELAVALGKPLFLHERDRDAAKGAPLGSARDLLAVLAECGPAPSKVCVHCFTGTRETLRSYVSKGYLIGLTGFVGMRQRGGHVRAMLSAGELPLEQLMLETDCPFMLPDKGYLPADINIEGRRNEPCVMPAVCRAAAECLGRPAVEVAAATTANAASFFGL